MDSNSKISVDTKDDAYNVWAELTDEKGINLIDPRPSLDDPTALSDWLHRR